MASPTVAYAELRNEGSGITIHGFDNPTVESNAIEEMRPDIADVMNLCVMLSLHNVKSVEQLPPEALNKKRLKSNKLPLLGYHVLSVDGDAWDERKTGGEGSGVRTHMRRGHIRRLHATNRKVWVRATYGPRFQAWNDR